MVRCCCFCHLLRDLQGATKTCAVRLRSVSICRSRGGRSRGSTPHRSFCGTSTVEIGPRRSPQRTLTTETCEIGDSVGARGSGGNTRWVQLVSCHMVNVDRCSTLFYSMVGLQQPESTRPPAGVIGPFDPLADALPSRDASHFCSRTRLPAAGYPSTPSVSASLPLGCRSALCCYRRRWTSCKGGRGC